MNQSEPVGTVYDRIRDEHVALRDKLGRIHSVLASEEISEKEIQRLLEEFHAALKLHFAGEEEVEGFFEDVVTRAPQLASRADRLYHEHEDLLQRADELCRFAAAGSPSLTWWRELSCRCHEFSRDLMHHESEENQLLQAVYQDDIGTTD